MATSDTIYSNSSVNWTTLKPTVTSARHADCGLEPGQCETVRVIKEVTLSISIIALVTSILCLIILRKYRLFHQRVMFHLLVANLCSASVIISSDATPELADTPGCIIQGFFVQFFGFAEVLWFWNLTLVFFMHLVKERDTVSHELTYTVVGWTVPLLTACLPLITMDYGPADAPFCWLESDAWRFGVYWGPVFIGLAVIPVMFVYMIWHTKKAISRYTEPCDQFTRNHKALVKSYLKPLAAYAATFLVLNLIQIANRIQNALAPPIYSFVIFHTAIISCYGMILSLLFVITNGRQEFTREKFENGFLHHIQTIRQCRMKKRPAIQRGVIISTNTTVANAADVPISVIEMEDGQVRESACHANPNLSFGADDCVSDSGIEEVDANADVSHVD